MKIQLFLLLIITIYLSAIMQSYAQSTMTLDNIDQYLLQQEYAFSDLIPGTEKSIVWHQGVKQKTNYSIVYIHGFSASAKEISPVTENLAVSLGANLFFTRLTGHGRTSKAMALGSVTEWQDDVRQAIEIATLIGNKVILVSTSTGATLATWLIAQPDLNQQISASIQISPNYAMRDQSSKVLQWKLGLWLAKLWNGDTHQFKPHSDMQKQYWTEKYPLEAVVPVVELVNIVEDIDKSKITIPHLIIYSMQDKVIDPEKVVEVGKQYSNARLVEFKTSTDPSQHVLAGDAVSQESNNDMLLLISNYLAKLGIKKLKTNLISFQ